MITFTPLQSVFLFLAYFIAAIPFGVVVGLLVSGKDVREQGSGNTGATNVSRMLGKKWGVAVLILDALKGYIIVCLSSRYGGPLFVNLVAVLVIVAHCWPIYLGFKGGKGVATSMGVLAFLSPKILGVAVVIFILVVIASRRVSAGSLSAALVVPLIAALFSGGVMMTITAFIIAAIVWWKHRENAIRLWRNEEPAFF